jgi:hypothetical protein
MLSIEIQPLKNNTVMVLNSEDIFERHYFCAPQENASIVSNFDTRLDDRPCSVSRLHQLPLADVM